MSKFLFMRQPIRVISVICGSKTSAAISVISGRKKQCQSTALAHPKFNLHKIRVISAIFGSEKTIPLIRSYLKIRVISVICGSKTSAAISVISGRKKTVSINCACASKIQSA